MATVADRILDHLSGVPSGLDDGQLAEALGARRQTVNQACRRLSEQGRLHRAPGPGGIIVNRLFNVNGSANGSASTAPAASADVSEPLALPESRAVAATTETLEAPAVPESDDTTEPLETTEPPETTEIIEPAAAVAESATGAAESDDSAATAEAVVVVGPPSTDLPSVPQAREAADDQVAPDPASEQTRIPVARPGEPETVASSIPAARTSEADDAPAGVGVPAVEESTSVATPDPTSPDPTSTASEPTAEPDVVADTAAAVIAPPAEVADVEVADVEVDQGEAGEAPSDAGASGQAGGRPWWKRLLPWGNG